MPSTKPASSTISRSAAIASPVPETDILTLQDVSVRFPRRPEAVLSDVSVRLAPGEQLIVFGASGSGKSTLLQTITGVIPHSVVASLGGSVRMGGTLSIETSVVELSRLVGVVAQDPASSVCLPDVEQELALPLENRGVDPALISARIDRALDAVQARMLRHRSTGQLSGGEGQRVALAATLIAEPAVLLLDEPTSMLDAAGLGAVRRAIRSAVDTYRPAVVLVEHRIDEFTGTAGIAGLPPRALVLGEAGTVIADGPTVDVLAQHGRSLNQNGCWLPLETELLAVTGCAGGLGEPGVRAGLRSLGEPAGALGRRQDFGRIVLTATDVVIDRGVGAPNGTATPVLAGVSLDLRGGEIVALLGGNGTGKTSLLLTLAGLHRPSVGTVTGARPGMIFQNAEHQFVEHTVRGEIRHGLPSLSDDELQAILHRHRLTHLADQSPYRLSGGEKRRLSVAAMLAHDRPVLLADEPTFGLDRRDTIATLAALGQAADAGRSILFSSHDLRTVATLADRVIVLADRTVIADGPVFEVLRWDEVLKQAGLELPPLIRHLLKEFDSDARIRRVLGQLDAAVGAPT
ncbi:ATP-binding cassette domain-containing protein [Cryobacterium sp. Hh7]|nr:ATP-binding cassette domain-containing protein [Cryobacterium sp. Hh7]